MILIGIDPDSEKSGVCVYDAKAEKLLSLANMEFYDLLDYILENRECTFYIEAGYMHKSVFHASKKFSSSKNSNIGLRVGYCNMVGVLLVQFCKRHNIKYNAVPPKARVHREKALCMANKLAYSTVGKTKTSHDQFKVITKSNLKKTNQEQRDAAMLVWGR